jgi:hypothetical protein
MTIPVVASTHQPLLLDADYSPVVSLDVPSGAFTVQGAVAGSSALLAAPETWSNAPTPLLSNPVPVAVLDATELSYMEPVADNRTLEQPLFPDETTQAKNATDTKIVVPWRDGVVSPVVHLTLADPTLDSNLASNITLTFMVKRITQQKMSPNISDYCLAYIYSEEESWQCVFDDEVGKREDLVEDPDDDGVSVLQRLSGPTDRMNAAFAIVFKPALPRSRSLAQVVPRILQYLYAFMAGILFLVLAAVFGVWAKKKANRLRKKKHAQRDAMASEARAQDEQRKKLDDLETEEEILIENPIRVQVLLRLGASVAKIEVKVAAQKLEDEEASKMQADLAAQILALEQGMDDLDFDLDVGDDMATDLPGSLVGGVSPVALPSHWQELQSEDESTYFWNSETYESSWVHPNELKKVAPSKRHSLVTRRVSSVAQAPEGRAGEDTDLVEYGFNVADDADELPEIPDLPVAVSMPDVPDLPSSAPGEGLPLPEPWSEIFDGHSGRSYFYNRDTDESSWTHPAELLLIPKERQRRMSMPGQSPPDIPADLPDLDFS